MCSTTPLKLKVIQKVVAPNHKRDGDGATSVKYEAIKKKVSSVLNDIGLVWFGLSCFFVFLS